ncbi:MAG: hypothetical protein JJLCMIEE_00494 [Acidimicrobiales bacterium]|nr:MAG: DUF2017 family protein [Actinomycetota bacterium]MBV6507446.1 hypothetical protein [Acidimicrobiales bacterium]RIK07826.1 MAG: hypothetical protein DCC48_02420 [Acidobacteriota bacterium]
MSDVVPSEPSWSSSDEPWVLRNDADEYELNFPAEAAEQLRWTLFRLPREFTRKDLPGFEITLVAGADPDDPEAPGEPRVVDNDTLDSIGLEAVAQISRLSGLPSLGREELARFANALETATTVLGAHLQISDQQEEGSTDADLLVGQELLERLLEETLDAVVRLIQPNRDGTFRLRLGEGDRDLIRSMIPEMRDLLLAGDPSLRRLFPPAYGTDDKRNAEYDALVHDDLLEHRLASLDIVEGTLDEETVDEEGLLRWMQALNDIRLVLGTRLDVTEEMVPPDPAHPSAGMFIVYARLGYLLSNIVKALRTTL